MQHPRDVLFPGEKPFPALPAVDHYAGSEKLMHKALALQHDQARGLAAGRHAVARVEIDPKDYEEAWRQFMAEWLPGSGYQPGNAQMFN